MMKITQGVMAKALVGIALFSVGMIGLLGFQGGPTTFSADSRYRADAITPVDEPFGGFREMTVVSISADIGTVSDDFDDRSSLFTVWQDTRANGLLFRGNEIKFTPGAKADSSGASGISTGDTPATLTITWKAPPEKASDIGVRFVTSTFL